MDLSDLFSSYNKDITRKFKPAVVLGPPASGKSFIIKNYYYSNARESIIGFTNLKPVRTCDEHEPHGEESRTNKAGGDVNKVLDFLEAVFPWIETLTNTESLDEALDELRRSGFTNDELGLINDYFSNVSKVPKRLVEHLVELRRECSLNGPIMLYYIPWDVDERYKDELSGEVGEAVAMIKRHFEKGIKWLGVKYIPPGLVAEVVGKIRGEGRDRAEEYVKEQANAYYRVVRLLINEEDFELKGLIAEGINELIKQFAVNAVKYVASLISPTAAFALPIILSLTYRLTRKPETNVVNEVIEFSNYWRSLHPSLRRLIASKVALQLSITPKKAEDTIDQLTGMDIGQLKQLINDIQNKLEELEKKLNYLEINVNLLEQQIKGFIIYKLSDIADGRLYPNVRLVGDDLGIVSTMYGEFEVSIVRTRRFNDYLNQIMNKLSNESVVLIGPKGIGKSTLTVYAVWRLLREGGYYGVIRINELADDNARLGLENFLRTYTRDLAETFGKLIILYDPSTTEAYTTPGVRIEVKPTVTGTIRQLMELAKKLSELQASLIIVIPSDVYNALGKVLSDEVKASLDRYKIDVDLRDEEFISDLITEYSGCAINEDKLREIVKSILNFDEGHALIARLVGEELRRNNCRVENVKELLWIASKDALTFMVDYVNRRLGVITENGEWDPRRIKAFSRILLIWQQFSSDVEPGDYVMPRRFLIRWFDWEGLTYDEDLITLLAQKHHLLIDITLSYIALPSIYPSRKRMKEFLRSRSKNFREAIKPWIEHGEKVRKSNVPPDEYSVVKHFLNKYEDNLMQELKQELECWRRFALLIGTAILEYSLGEFLGEVNDLLRVSGDVFNGLKKAVKPCSVDRLFLENGDFTPFSRALLEFGHDIYKVYAGKWRKIAIELKGLEDKWLRRGVKTHYDVDKRTFIESVYALGLVILLASAKAAGENVDTDAVKTALWIFENYVKKHHSLLDDVIMKKLLNPLRDPYKNRWA